MRPTFLSPLALIVALSLAACEGDDGEGETATTSTTTDATTTASTTEASTTASTTEASTTIDDTTTTGDDTTTSETTTTTTTTDGGISFAGDVFPIITVACTCHVDVGSGGLAMPDASTAYANLVGVPASGLPTMDRVAAGDLDNSYLIHKIRGTQADVGGAGGKMPLGDSLTADELKTFEDWVLGNALP